ncbi:hypothetical protein F7O84_14610 [Candidatus Galacturonibacter soehngenii]|uniref:Uncharacterized protein n=1 Tax=Candidatus Galacturonatibacter soehngenii TaxID=2307010 RepID=A0A7V7QIT3_9FIRM|nr:hypothetical protein F7O84_14610 [Candidatus Galacturonibacter soehngenii]
MSEGDGEANYAYYCLHKLKILPSQFASMDRYEKAFIIASIDLKIEADKKEAARAKKAGKK